MADSDLDLDASLLDAHLPALIAAMFQVDKARVPSLYTSAILAVGVLCPLNGYPGRPFYLSINMYIYSFEPNYQWPNHFPPQLVMLDYFRRMAEKYHLRKNVRVEST